MWEMTEQIQIELVPGKEYNQCIKCEYLGIKCDGPNLTAMSVDRFCEWCRLRKEYLGWTNAYLIDLSGVSKGTIDKIMAGNAPGLNGETKSKIACALIYREHAEGSWGRYPCAMAALGVDDHADAASIECAALREQLEEICEERDALAEKLAEQQAISDRANKLLDDRHGYMKTKDFYIRAFLIALCISVCGNIALLLKIISVLA